MRMMSLNGKIIQLSDVGRVQHVRQLKFCKDGNMKPYNSGREVSYFIKSEAYKVRIAC